MTLTQGKKAERKEHSENTSDLNWGGRRVVSPPQDETKPPVWERKSLATSQGQIIRFFLSTPIWGSSCQMNLFYITFHFDPKNGSSFAQCYNDGR